MHWLLGARWTSSGLNVVYKWKTVPPEKEDEEPKNYVWDEKAKEWLPDQDMDGIPDTFEKPPG